MSRPSPTPSRVLASFALTLVACAARAQSPLEWRELAPLPVAIGFGGPLCGAHGDLLLVAGGANFPDRPPWEGGAKVWHDGVFALAEPDGEWRRVGALRHPLAYAAVVSHDDGIVVLGGDDGVRAYRDAFVLRVVGSILDREELPPLPQPSTLLGACRIDDVVYAAAGQTRVAALPSSSLGKIVPTRVGVNAVGKHS